MKIEQNPGSRYYTVLINPGELVTSSGRTLPYPTWAGAIRKDGLIDVWTPAARVPRDYRAAAKALLEQVRSQLVAEGKVVLAKRYR